MRAREILENASAATSSAGSIATIAQPLGMVARSGGSLLNGKYTTDLTPNTQYSGLDEKTQEEDTKC